MIGAGFATFFFYSCVAIARAEQPRPMSMDQFVSAAVTTGLNAERNRRQYQSASYAKSAVLRQTSLPSLTAAINGNRANLKTNQSTTKIDTGQGTLALDETLPLGTVLNLTGKYTTSLTASPTQTERNILRPGWSATLAQPIFLFVHNPILRLRKQTALNFDNAEDAYKANILSIRSQARGLYYDVLLKRESLVVEGRKLNSAKALLDITTDLVKAGKLAPVEMTRTRVRLELDQRQNRSALNELAKSKQNANNFLRLQLDAPVEYTSQLVYEPFTADLEELTQYALVNQPDMRIQLRAETLAQLGLDQAREGLRPTLNANASYGSNLTDSIINDVRSRTQERDWLVGATASWRFFDFNISRDIRKQAELNKELADLAYEQARRATILSVKNAYMDVKNAEEQLLGFNQLLKSAKDNVEVLRLQFMSGRGRIIDIFDAEDQARRVNLDYLNLLVNYYLTQDRLAYLVGRELRI